MKKLTVRALFFAVVTMVIAAPAARAQVDVNVSIGGFYDELAPYGQWVDCTYGQCWVPARVAAGWQPYSNGQWIYTEYGWTWVSSDPWGGNPYHYGTWASIPGYGWSWVPGTVWAPAWVTWSYSNNYVGWAPLPPSVAFGVSGYSGAPVVVRETHYVFVPTNRFVGRSVESVRVPAQQSAQIFRQTTHVTSFAVSGGVVRNMALPMATIERGGGGRIETRSIQTAGTAPRAMAAGTTHLAVVAPAREMKAAAAARPHPVGHPTESSPVAVHSKAAPPPGSSNGPGEPKGHEARPAPANRPAAPTPESEAKAARPQPVQEPKHAKAPVEHAPANSSKPPKGSDAPPVQAHRPPAESPDARPPGSPHPAEANRPSQPHDAPKPKANPPKEKPVEKDGKPDTGKP